MRDEMMELESNPLLFSSEVWMCRISSKSFKLHGWMNKWMRRVVMSVWWGDFRVYELRVHLKYSINSAWNESLNYIQRSESNNNINNSRERRRSNIYSPTTSFMSTLNPTNSMFLMLECPQFSTYVIRHFARFDGKHEVNVYFIWVMNF